MDHPNLAGMVFGWSPFRIVSNVPAHQPRWPPWLKIENFAQKIVKNLLWNCLANLDQTLLEWSFKDLSELYPLELIELHRRLPPCISGHSFNIEAYGKNNEKSSRLKLLGHLEPIFDGMVIGWSFFNPWTRAPSEMATISGHSFKIRPYRKKEEKSSRLKLLG